MELKTRIKQCLQSFSQGNLRDNSLALLNTLGYQSEKTLDLGGSPEAFLDQFDNNADRAFRKDKALFNDWKEIHLLFQLTDQELSGQSNLFEANEVSQGLMSSYLFFAISLTGGSYARGKLAQITRQLNRLFPMPVMVLFEYNEKLSIAVINRRRHKRDADKDVLGKVTFIQDISLASPHRGHLDILGSFSLSALAGRKGIHSFDDLHAAWEEIFNVELLNKKFYRELSNWYFWAMQNVHFPFDDAEADKRDLFRSDEKIREHDAKNLIRLLTRLLFVWFIKEKELIPEALFDSDKLGQDLLKNFDPDSRHTRFYKAILQNLFFATLNQEMGKRAFRRSGQNRNVTNLLRYESYFKNPETFIELAEKQTPFMNGGLFECLDKPHPTRKGSQGGEVILFEDGFSDRGDNTLKVPDFLFFGKEETIDLSGVYGDKKRKNEKVRGIIPILNNYKFTIVENTPIEQEVALDPELLGKVFENLLASYNPETKTTARKQTGSFYTPRTIVDYMVDESLKAYLNKALCEACPEVTEEDAKEGLDILFAYREKEHAFTDAEKSALIVAIDNCKILDPACGSGAFPMGILHKLELILGKLDPNNRMWRDRQIGKVDATITAAEQIDDTTIREHTIRDLEAQKQDVEEAFANNDLGYGRKLYLIENCIYGVDIQSIATQVSKLRFFISLIVEQGSNPEKENFGIRPLPNLETKFTTANTLIGIESAAQGELAETEKVEELKKELKQIRHNLFNAKTPKTKRKYRMRDKELRKQIAEALEANGWSSDSARQLSQWDPYDQNKSAYFFDPEWMFGITDGFHVIIGNPPYLGGREWKKENKLLFNYYLNEYDVAEYQYDMYVLFWERGIRLARDTGVITYITPNTWLNNKSTVRLRRYILKTTRILAIADYSREVVFDAGIVLPIVTILQRPLALGHDAIVLVPEDGGLRELLRIRQSAWAEDPDAIINLDISETDILLRSKIVSDAIPVSDLATVKFGIKLYETGKGDPPQKAVAARDHIFQASTRKDATYRRYLEGKDVSRFALKWQDRWLKYGKNLAAPRKPELFEGPRLLFRRIVGERLIGTFTDSDYVTSQLLQIVKTHDDSTAKILLGILNSTLMAYYFRKKYNRQDKTFPEIRIYELAELPMKRRAFSTTKPWAEIGALEALVSRIIEVKEHDGDADVFTEESALDALVCELYELTPDEIAIVEDWGDSR